MSRSKIYIERKSFLNCSLVTFLERLNWLIQVEGCVVIDSLNNRGQCGRARSFISTGENPVPAGQASHREESLGPAGIIPKVKHRVIEPTGRNSTLSDYNCFFAS